MLMGLLIASFAIWGIGDIFRNRSGVVAQVGEAEITDVSFNQEFRNRVQGLQAQFDGPFTQAQAVQYGLHQQVILEMIRRASLDEEARLLGLRTTNSIVLQTIENMDAFKDGTGIFSNFSYKLVLQRANYTPKHFEDLIRADMARSKLLDTVSGTKNFPKSFVNTLYTYRKEQRKASVLSIPASAVTDVPAPTEEQLVTYHTDNASGFMAPEYRSFNYIVLKPSDFAGDDEFSEDQLRAEYEERISDYSVPDLRGIDVVMLSEERDAKAFINRVNAGEDFITVGAEVSGFESSEISLGDLSQEDIRNDYTEDASNKVFFLPLNGLSEPVQTLFGWYVFRVNKIEDGMKQSFEDVRDDLHEKMLADIGIDALFETINKIDDEIAGRAELDVIAETLKLNLLRAHNLDRSGLDQEGAFVTQKDVSFVLAKAFDLGIGEDLEVFDGADNVYYLVQVQEIIVPVLKPLDDVRGLVESRWTFDEKNRIAGERADKAMTDAQAGKSFAAIATETGGTIFETPVLIRDEVAMQRDVAANIGRLVFSIAKGDVEMERAVTGNGYVLVLVTDITAGAIDETSEAHKTLTAQLQTEFENDLLLQYQNAVQAGFEITINWPRIDELINPDSQITQQSIF
jgi:peptidyl-prolyl cis-trans isomerase D